LPDVLNQYSTLEGVAVSLQLLELLERAVDNMIVVAAEEDEKVVVVGIDSAAEQAQKFEGLEMDAASRTEGVELELMFEDRAESVLRTGGEPRPRLHSTYASWEGVNRYRRNCTRQ
jgi:hypothetical protein